MRQTCQYKAKATGEECGKPAVDFRVVWGLDPGTSDGSFEESTFVELRQWLCAEHWDAIEERTALLRELLREASERHEKTLKKFQDDDNV